MAKVKNRKRISADQIHKKRQNQNAKKPLNPFEMHINKEKMRVLGQKLKNDRGLPGISRAKAIQKRKQTLLHEYKQQHKSNRFLDKRIREKSQMSEEEKAIARFAAVRFKAHNQKNIDDPKNDFTLTHKNQSLSEIEKFEYNDLHSDDEDSIGEDKNGRLDSSFVGDAHFGGDLFKNSGQEGAKTHKQLIEQLIEESKKRKAEKQKIKEATMELTEKLDSEWKDLVQLVNKNIKKEESKEVEKSKLDEYDKVMRELRFEARGTVSDRLKTEDEVAQEEKDKLDKLEQERLERMRGFPADAHEPKHRSADDLDDEFVYESDAEDNMLSYDQEGQSNVKVHAELNGKTVGEAEKNDQEEQENSENDSDEDVAEEEPDSEDSLADLKGEEHSADSDSDSEIVSKTTINNETRVKHTLEADSKNENKKKIKLNDTRPLEAVSDCTGTETENKRNDKVDELSQAEKKELEKAGNELPFTFNLPESYESFMETLKSHPVHYQKIILERMIKCNHPSLSQGNKEGLGLLFQFLLQYLNDLFSDNDETQTLKESFQIFKALMPHIYDLAQLNKENTYRSLQAVIKEKHEDYRKKKKKYPGIEVFVFLKLVSLLFPTSDFRNQVVTPCFMFMEQMLRCCEVRNAGEISYGILLCTLILEYTSLSNRYLPAAVNFLGGIFHMAIPKTSVRILKVLPPFKSLSSDLVLTTNCSSMEITDKLPISSLVEKELTDHYKILVIYITLKLLRDFIENLKNLLSNVEIFSVVEKYVHQIPMEFYPKEVKAAHKEVCASLTKLESERKLQYLIMEDKKPKALRLYEPKIVEVYDGKRHKVQSKEKAERAKLQYKLKKETKGALREIRRDKAFLGRVQINEKIRSDKERRERVNKIFAEAAVQQSELNSLDRKNKKKK